MVSFYSDVNELLCVAGIFAFGALGALTAVGRNFHAVLVTFCAETTALGGGLVRDLIIGAPPVAFHRPDYYLIPLAATLVVLTMQARIQRYLWRLQIVDSMGIGVFCVAGTDRALAYGQAPLAAAVLGAFTAVGGGIISDLMCGQPPRTLRRGHDFYAEPAAAGALLAALLIPLHESDPLTGSAITLGVFVLRLVTLRFGGLQPVGQVIAM